MLRSIKTICFLTTVIGFFAGCYYRNEDELYPCTSANITYTNTIKAIIDARCIVCHNGSGPNLPEKYDFRQYSVFSRVALSDSVRKAITGQFPGKPRMPYGGPYLSDCEIAKIRTWVNHGAPF